MRSKNIKPSDMNSILSNHIIDLDYGKNIKHIFTPEQYEIIEDCVDYAFSSGDIITRSTFYSYLMEYTYLFDERNIREAVDEAMRRYNKMLKNHTILSSKRQYDDRKDFVRWYNKNVAEPDYGYNVPVSKITVDDLNDDNSNLMEIYYGWQDNNKSDLDYDLDAKYNFTPIQKRFIKMSVIYALREDITNENAIYEYLIKKHPSYFDERNIRQAVDEAMIIYEDMVKKDLGLLSSKRHSKKKRLLSSLNYDLYTKYNFSYIQKRIIRECAKEFAQEGYVVLNKNSFNKYFMNFPEIFDERNIAEACNEAMKMYDKYMKR